MEQVREEKREGDKLTKETNLNQSNENNFAEKGSNINVNKTYMTSHNFLIGASLISIFVMNILLAMFINNYLESQKENIERSIVRFKKEITEENLRLEKTVLERIEKQDDLLSTFISVESRRR